jgi:RNA polymerase sigma-70 factor (ECF subfamily)
VREPSEDELDAWMARLAVGERAAFDPLFRALYPRALRLARVRLHDDHASDAAQTVMMKVFARASEFEAGKPVLPWFYAAAANEIHTLSRRLRTQGQRATSEAPAHLLPGRDDPERLALENELRSCLARAIASLDEASAEAIACLLEDRPLPGVSAAAFRKRVSRAYARLRLLLRGSHAE